MLLYIPLIAKRIKNEEAVLEEGLEGYKEYKLRVKYKVLPDPAYPNDKAIFVTNLGTQADKSLSAIQLVDSLIRTLPIKENALESARYAIVADANNDYPTFRSLPSIVQGYDRLGYTADPDKDVLDNISSIDSAALKTYYDKSVAPTPIAWIIVGDRKTLPMES